MYSNQRPRAQSSIKVTPSRTRNITSFPDSPRPRTHVSANYNPGDRCLRTDEHFRRHIGCEVDRSQSVFYFVPQDSHSQAGSTSSGWKLDNIIWRCQCHTQRQRHRASKAQHMLYIFFLKALGSRILNMTFVCVKSKIHKYAKCLKGPTYMLLKDIK